MTHIMMFLRLQIRKDIESHLVFAEHHSLCWNMLFCSTFMQVSQDFQIFRPQSQAQSLPAVQPWSKNSFSLCCLL